MTPQNDIATLYTLRDRGQTIYGAVDDVRGRTVKDTDGTDIAMVTDLLINDHEQQVGLPRLWLTLGVGVS